MARTITLANLRALVQWVSDTSGLSLRHTTADLNTQINLSKQRFREAISDAGLPYYLVSKNGTTGVGPTSPYAFHEIDMTAFAPTVVRVYGVDLTISARIVSLAACEFEERNSFQPAPFAVGGSSSLSNGFPLAFTMYNDVKLCLLPPPMAAYPYTVWYLPVDPDMSADGDTFDGKAGWEWWIAWDVYHALLHRDAKPELITSVKMERDKVMEDILKRSRHLQRAGATGRRDVRGERRRVKEMRRWYL
jgi:hypothetical protein